MLRIMIFHINIFGKRFPNPLEELLIEITTGIQHLFPQLKGSSYQLVLENPPNFIESDYSFSTFSIAVLTKLSPVDIAARIVEYFAENPLVIINEVNAIGPYVNIEVDKKLFRKKSLAHILDQGKKFGTYNLKNHASVIICYTSSNSTSKMTLDDLRQLLVGKVIGECYIRGGDYVKYNYYIADWDTEQNDGVKTQLKKYFQAPQYRRRNVLKLLKKRKKIILKNIKKTHKRIGFSISSYDLESEFFLLGKKVVEDAMRQKLAAHAANTQVVITLPIDKIPPLVLQKNDGSVTSFARHLAYIKSCLLKTRTSAMICLSSKEKTNSTEYLIALAKKLKYSSTEVSINAVYLSQNYSHEDLLTNIDPSLKYSILRTPLNKEIDISAESLTYYSRIVNVTNQLTIWSGENDLFDDFNIIKLLISLPMVIRDVRLSHDPSCICMYLEEVVQECKKKLTNDDKLLSKAVLIVLNNGLNILTY